MRSDPVIQAAQAVEELQNSKLKNTINSQLIDLAKVQSELKSELDHKRLNNMAHNIINLFRTNEVFEYVCICRHDHIQM